MKFCSEYIETGNPIGLPQSLHDYTRQSRGTRGINVVTMDHQKVSQAPICIKKHIRGYPVHRCSQTKCVSYLPKDEHDEGVARAQ